MKIEEIIIIFFSLGISAYAGYHLYMLWKIKNRVLEQLYNKNSLAYLSYAKTLKTLTTTNSQKSFTPAKQFFSLEKLLKDNGLNPRLYLAIPSLLVGLGVLGTFIGFSMTVWSVGDLLDSSNQLESMKKLFASVKIAFASSVAGMLWSFIFSKCEKIQFYGLEEKINGRCNELDNIHYQAHDDYVRDFIGNIENTLTTDINRAFTDNINSSFKIINDTIKGKIGELLQEPTEALKIQSENFGKQLESWEAALVEQNKIMVTSTAQLAGLPVALTKQLQDIANSFTALDQNIGVTIGSLASVNNEVDAYIKKWLSAIQLQAAAITQLEDSVKNINIILASVPAMAQELDKINKAFEKTVKSFEKTEKVLSGNIGTISQSVNQAMTTIPQLQLSVQNFGCEINTEHRELKMVIDTLEKSIKTVFQGLDTTIEQRMTRTNTLLNDYFSMIDKLSVKIIATYNSTKNP